MLNRERLKHSSWFAHGQFFFEYWWDQFHQDRSFWKIKEKNSVMVNLFKSSKWSKIVNWKVTRTKDWIPNPAIWSMTWVGNLIISFLIDWVIFCIQKINLIVKKIESLSSMFLKIHRINLLMVDLFLRLNWLIHLRLRSIFSIDWWEWFDHGQSF